MSETIRKHVFLPAELLAEVNQTRFEGRFASEADAIRRLIEAGIDSQNGHGYVYLAVGGKHGLLKIGHSRNPEQRMQGLSSSEGKPVDLIGCLDGGRDLELTAHIVWGEHRVRGEWFLDQPAIRKWFEDHPSFVGLDLKAGGRSRRIPVQMTKSERDAVAAAARKDGIALSAWMRVKALEAARK